MTEFTRRNFLHLLAASLGSLGSLYLAGCLDQAKLLSKTISANKITQTPYLPAPTSLGELPELESEGSEMDLPTSTPSPTASFPELAVARGGEPEEMVRAAVRALGGMQRFVTAGDVVVVKPNICVAYHTYEYAATTNPWVVGAVVRMALEAGAKQVKVLDFPFGGSAEQAYQISGIQEKVNQAGGKMVVMSGIKFIETPIPAGKDLKTAMIFDDVLRADVLINVPIAKNHELARLTLGMKNLMGVISNRPAMHANLGQRLADLSTRIRSHLVIVDAVRMLMAHGPTGGNLSDVRKADTVIASSNIVSADSYAATLFGIDPQILTYIQKGAEMGLGSGNISDMKIEEINLG